MNNETNLSTHNLTVPTTIGALLTEEWTIDPLSHLPSFLELTFVDVARNSGRKALSAAWDVVVGWLEGMMRRLHQLERIVDRSIASHSCAPPHSIHLLQVIKTLTIQLSRLRIKILRRLCDMFLRTVKSLGPELQTLIMYAIDYNCMHYLAGATACEMVYGLKRSKIIKQPYATNGDNKQQQLQQPNKVAELTKFDKTLSALLAALLPYCKQKCDRIYSDWKSEQSNDSSGNSLRSYHMPINIARSTTNQRSSNSTSLIQSKKQNFIQLYPYFHMVHEGSIFLYQFAYLLEYTPYWSFSLHALGVMLRRMTVADVQQQQQQKQMKQQQHQQIQSQPKDNRILSSAAIKSNQALNAKNPTKLTIPRLVRGAVLFSVSYTLLSGWYSHFKRQLRLRRRRWIAEDEDEPFASTQTNDGNDGMNNNSNSRRRKSKLPIPPPPLPPNNLIDASDKDLDRWSCPICKQPRINPTASTSGYVFCYKCLVSHLRQKGEYCPVTGMACWESKVVRLFEPTAQTATHVT